MAAPFWDAGRGGGRTSFTPFLGGNLPVATLSFKFPLPAYHGKFWGGISRAGQLPKFSPPPRMRSRLGHTWGEGWTTAVEELDFKVGRTKTIQQQRQEKVWHFSFLEVYGHLYVGDTWGCIRGNYGGRGNCQFLPAELDQHPILWQPSCPSGQSRGRPLQQWDRGRFLPHFMT